MQTLFGDGTCASSPSSLAYPFALAAHPITGDVFAADSGGGRVLRITPGGAMTALAGGVIGWADGAGGAAKFNGPQGVGFDAALNVLVGDCYNNRVRSISPEGQVSTVAGSGAGTSARWP